MLMENPGLRAMPLITYPGLELTGETIRDAVTDGDAHAACMEAMAVTWPSAAATSIMDLSVEAEAFGSTVAFSENEVPTVTGRIVSGPDDIASLSVPVVGAKRTGHCIRAVERAAAAINDRPVLGGMIGPYSLAGRLFDMTEIMTAVMLEPAAVHALLEKTVAFLGNYLGELKHAGADGVLVAEPAAGLLSPELCDEFSSGYIRRMIEAAQDDSFMVVLHNCGANASHVATMLSTGAGCLHFGNHVDMEDILDRAPGHVLISGNIDPVGIMRNGTPADVERAVRDLLASAQESANFLLSTGCDVPPGTPIPNVEAFYRTIPGQQPPVNRPAGLHR